MSRCTVTTQTAKMNCLNASPACCLAGDATCDKTRVERWDRGCPGYIWDDQTLGPTRVRLDDRAVKQKSFAWWEFKWNQQR